MKHFTRPWNKLFFSICLCSEKKSYLFRSRETTTTCPSVCPLLLKWAPTEETKPHSVIDSETAKFAQILLTVEQYYREEVSNGADSVCSLWAWPLIATKEQIMGELINQSERYMVWIHELLCIWKGQMQSNSRPFFMAE